MSSKALPELVDLQVLAREGATLEGTLSLASFTRMAEYLVQDEGEVEVFLEFHRPRKDRIHIRGRLRARVALACQYCLEPVEVDLDAPIDFMASRDDDQVRELSETGEAMLLAGDRITLVALLEDDLMLSLPMVPRHGAGECIEKLGYTGDTQARKGPFAALAALSEDLRRKGRN